VTKAEFYYNWYFIYLTPCPPLRKKRGGNSFRSRKLPSPFTERVPEQSEGG